MQLARTRCLNAAMTYFAAVGLTVSLFCVGGKAFADTGANVVVTTPEGKPAEGSDVTLTPLFPKDSKGKTVKADKDGAAAFPGQTEGDYNVTVVGGGTVTTYFIHIAKDKTTEQKSSEEGPRSLYSTPDAKTVNRLVEVINDAAKKCDKKFYDLFKTAFDALLKSVQAQLVELEKLVSDEHEENHFPTDIGGLDDMKSLPMEKANKDTFDTFYALVQERDRLKVAADLAKAKEKELKPLATNCDPPKSGTSETPKTDAPPPSDKPK